LKEFEQIFQKELNDVGKGHVSAANYDDQSGQRLKRLHEHEEMAVLRGRLAASVHREEKMCLENKENAHIIARQFALEQEKIRSSQIVKMAPPTASTNENLNKTDSKQVKLVSYHDANAFMTTRYHMPDSVVDKTMPSETVIKLCEK
jgi:hypothetical protein